MGLEIENLFTAIYRGECGRIRELLEAGVSPDIRNSAGETALSYAALQGQDDCVVALLEAGASPDPLPMIEAAVSPNPSVMRRFLALGGKPNTSDERGWTPLMEAAHWGNIDTVQLLLEHGADPSRTTNNGTNVADAARAGGHPEVLPILDSATRS